MKNVEFIMKQDPDAQLAAVWKFVGVVSKTDEFCIKCEELCIKNEELCIKNDEFCSMCVEKFVRCDFMRICSVFYVFSTCFFVLFVC